MGEIVDRPNTNFHAFKSMQTKLFACVTALLNDKLIDLP